MTKQELKDFINKNLITKTGKINSRKLNKNESFYKDNINSFKQLQQLIPFTDSISQQIYHFLNDELSIRTCKCKDCNKSPNFITFTKGYNLYCSNKCKIKDSIKDIETYNKNKELKEFENTVDIDEIIKEYGEDEWNKLTQIQKTKFIRYKDINYNNTNKIKESLSKEENGLTGYEKRSNTLKYTLNNKDKKEKKQHYEKVVKTRKNDIDENGLNSYDRAIKKGVKTQRKKDINGLTGYERTSLKLKELKFHELGVRNHYKNKELLTKEFLIENFVNKNKFLIKEACDFYNCSLSTMLKYKDMFEIFLPNNISFGKLEGEIFNFIYSFKNNTIKTKKFISPFELDIFVENEFAVEFNGLMWHSFGKHKSSKFDNYEIEQFRKHNHLEKTILCENKNIQLFHIFENEWIEKENIWKSVLLNKMNQCDIIYARKCKIKEVNFKDVKIFLEENHLQGHINSNINLGLYYNNELLSLMTFGKSRYNKNIEYELLRFCNKLNITVVGGASKLLKHFERNYKPKSLISYANRRWSQGNLYEKLGFEFKENTVPNYFYFQTNSNKLESRIKFQKHKLKNILKDFNETLTETENMYNHNYRKIYDSGNKVYIKNYLINN